MSPEQYGTFQSFVEWAVELSKMGTPDALPVTPEQAVIGACETMYGDLSPAQRLIIDRELIKAGA